MDTMTSTSRPDSKFPATFQGLSLVAGHPALDLVNTVKYRGNENPQDKLRDFADVVDWALTAGLASAAECAVLTQDFQSQTLWRKVVSLREALWSLLNFKLVSAKIYTRALATIETAISNLRHDAKINPQTGALTRHIRMQSWKSLVARIVASIADLLSHRSDLLIKTCDGCDCDWVFIDRTKASRRRWCDTKTCGNIARARNFRNKQKQRN